MKIAYVEDDADSLSLFGTRFRGEGHAFDGFESGEKALAAVGSGVYDALVVDIRLPGMSGVDLLAKLRAKHVHTPCVLITAFSSAGLTKQAVNASAQYLLEKPFTFSALKNVLEKITDAPAPLQHLVDRGLARLGLTPREEEIARLVLKGLSNAEIARAAGLSDKTVKQHVSEIFQKAQVENRAGLFSLIFPV